MNRHLFQDGVVLFQFQTFRSILLVFGRDIPRSTWHSTIFVLSTLENNLSARFFCFLGHADIFSKNSDGKISIFSEIIQFYKIFFPYGFTGRIR